jgi:hypothetical protein
MANHGADLRTVGTNGIAGWVPEIGYRPRVSATDFLHDISEGLATGYAAWGKTGYNDDVDVGSEDLWTVGGEYVWATGAMGMEVRSSNAGDHSTGTGVRVVRICYLDTAGAEQCEHVTMGGTAAVATTGTDIYRVNSFRATSCGTSGEALGDIDLRHLSDTPIYSQIATGFTRSRNITYTVPAGKTLYVTSISFSVGGATKERCAIVTTLATYDNYSGTLLDFFMPYHELIVEDGNFNKDLDPPTRLPAGTRIRVRATALTADTYVNAYLRGYLKDD